MAVDETLLERVGEGKSAPLLRLYAWDPPCLSIGYAQMLEDVDCARLLENGWDLVRRPTGGRAILHTDELTYAVIAPVHDPRLTGGVLESYRQLSSALLDALQRLNAPASVNPADPRDPDAQGPVCFEVPSQYEITVDGKKLIGSAQVRRKESVLQHGSLPLRGDLGRITQVLNSPDDSSRIEARGRLVAHATTLETALGRPVAWEDAAQAFTEAFEAVLNLQFTPQPLTQEERERAAALERGKYRSRSWTERR